MSPIKMHPTFFVTHPYKWFIECKIQHMTEARQVKMACDVPHLYQCVPVQACYTL